MALHRYVLIEKRPAPPPVASVRSEEGGETHIMRQCRQMRRPHRHYKSLAPPQNHLQIGMAFPSRSNHSHGCL
jgi:hypothetical protein